MCTAGVHWLESLRSDQAPLPACPEPEPAPAPASAPATHRIASHRIASRDGAVSLAGDVFYFLDTPALLACATANASAARALAFECHHSMENRHPSPFIAIPRQAIAALSALAGCQACNDSGVQGDAARIAPHLSSFTAERGAKRSDCLPRLADRPIEAILGRAEKPRLISMWRR